jgi:Shikimate kinase
MLPASTNNIFLIGPMGAGKTTIGRLLAEQLGRTFHDSDQVIEERAGADISWIFDKEGEPGFRKREANVIADLTSLDNIVLATGGGAILAEQNRRALHERGVVVYLMATVAQQLERTKRDSKRPLLRTDDPKARLTALMEIREPLYREIADISIMTSRRSPRAVAAEILKMLRNGGVQV